MEIMLLIQNHFNYSKPLVKITLFSLYPILIVINMIWGAYVGEPMNIAQLVIQLTLLLIIHIWIYSEPKFYQKIFSLEQVFPDPEYAKLCKRHMDLMYQLRFKTNSAGNWASAVYEILFKTSFLFFWTFMWIRCVHILRYFKFFPSNIIGNITVTLFSIALFFEFLQLLFLHFTYLLLRQVSNLPNVKKLKHNRYIPSSSFGLQCLSNNATISSVVFLIVSMLFTAVHLIAILIGIQSEEIVDLIKMRPDYFRFVTFLISVLGVGTFLMLYLLPKLFLKRIHRIWKTESLKKLENGLHLSEKSNDTSEVDRLISAIDRLSKDSLKIESSFLEMTVVLTTGILNVISIILNIRTFFPIG